MSDKLVETPQVSSIPTSSEHTAPELLSKFLKDNNIELRLTPPMVRQVDGGGILVEQPQVIANYKVTNSIAKN